MATLYIIEYLLFLLFEEVEHKCFCHIFPTLRSVFYSNNEDQGTVDVKNEANVPKLSCDFVFSTKLLKQGIGIH